MQLNNEQLEAVNFIEGALLVLAGAGSGKTRVVTNRIIRLLELGVPSSQILAVTFTNKAAGEMRERVQKMTSHDVLICTFHSLGARMLRESIHALGYGRDFTIYDEDDVLKLISTCLADLDIHDKKLDAKTFRGYISKAKNALQKPSEVEEEIPFLQKVYQCYEERLRQCNALDFDDLLFLTVRLLKECPDVLERYQQRWSFLLIDEYQDTNPSQYTIVKQLVTKSGNIFVVGDPDQSIYSWRGADITNILNFEEDFPGAKVVRLEQNYRSRSNILEAANALISNNQSRYEKKLWSDRGPGDSIKHYTADTDKDEANFVAERIRYHHDHHHIPLNEMVVFYRTNSQSRAFEDIFLARRIPYTIVGGLSFYQRKEIKDILAFLRMVHSGSDLISFTRTINLPKRGIGEATIEKIRMGSIQEGMSIFAFCEALVHGKPLQFPIKLPTKQFEGLKDYINVIHELKEVSKVVSLAELVKQSIEHSRYLSLLELDKATVEDRKENLDSLIAKAVDWELNASAPTLSAFLEELSLKSSLDEAETDKEHVSLMTIHNGKGLEFTVAFLVGMEEDLFPHANSRGNYDQIEEERRLCYVGMTRAKEFLYITDTRQRFIWGIVRSQRPSRFIREIPSEYLEKIRRNIRPTPLPPPDEFLTEMDQTIPEMESFAIGDNVFHKDFGVGMIRGESLSSMGPTFKVFFTKDNRERTLVARLANLKKL